MPVFPDCQAPGTIRSNVAALSRREHGGIRTRFFSPNLGQRDGVEPPFAGQYARIGGADKVSHFDFRTENLSERVAHAFGSRSDCPQGAGRRGGGQAEGSDRPRIPARSPRRYVRIVLETQFIPQKAGVRWPSFA